VTDSSFKGSVQCFSQQIVMSKRLSSTLKKKKNGADSCGENFFSGVNEKILVQYNLL